MSRSPTEEEEGITEEYRGAWEATRILTVQEGFSWSGNEKNHTFLNLGGLSFADVSKVSGCNCPGDGRSVSTLDWDDDGRIDFLLRNRTGPRVQFFRNLYAGDGRFLSVGLVGNGTSTNRDGIGARVEVDLGDRVLGRTLYAGDSFLTQSSKRLHFGLGDAERVARVTVRWPDGSEDTIRDVAADSRLQITQGDERAEVLSARTIAAMDDWRPKVVEPEKGVRRIVLAYELPMAEIPIPAYDAPDRKVADLTGDLVLLNLWQTTCLPCLKELKEFRQRAKDLRAAGLRVVPLNADLLIEPAETLETLAEFYPDTSEAGAWNPRVQAALQILYEDLFGSRNNLGMSLPVSFLLDDSGNLLLIYLGQVSAEQLLADAATVQAEDPRPVLDRLADGRRLIHHKRDFLALADAFEEAGEAELAAYYRRVDQETESYFIEDGVRRLLGPATPVVEEKKTSKVNARGDESGG